MKYERVPIRLIDLSAVLTDKEPRMEVYFKGELIDHDNVQDCAYKYVTSLEASEDEEGAFIVLNLADTVNYQYMQFIKELEEW